jgi:hypothetical protein
MITLQSKDGYFLLVNDDGRDVFVQSDWDFPRVASHLGLVPCDCGHTDGTIACAHKTAEAMIAAAREFLDDHEGGRFEDPGYFGIGSA